MGKLIIDGNSIYEIDEECLRQKERDKCKTQEKNKGQGEMQDTEPKK